MGELRAYMDWSYSFRPQGFMWRGVRCDIFRVVSCEASQTSEGFHPPADFVDILSKSYGQEVLGKCASLRGSCFIWKYSFGRCHSLPQDGTEVGGC